MSGRIFSKRGAALACAILFSALLFAPFPARAQTILTNCEAEEFYVVVQTGGLIKIQCDGIIVLTNVFEVSTNIVLDASGRRVTLQGSSSNRLFNVRPGAQFALTNLTLTGAGDIGASATAAGASGSDGRGGAIFNQGGVVTLDSVTLTSHTVRGGTGMAGAAGPFGSRGQQGGAGGSGRGGVIYNDGGVVHVLRSTVRDNLVIGGAGGNGGNGGPTGNGGSGGDAGGGGFGQGGAIYNTGGGELNIFNSSFIGNQASGATNGTGGAPGGVLGFPGRSEPAGAAQGAAIYSDSGTVRISSSTFSGNIGASAGGTGGYGGIRNQTGEGGYAGGAAQGGAIYNVSGSLVISNSTFSGNSLASGPGGAGGPGAGGGFGGDGGDGGNGGEAAGGALYHSGAEFARLINCTVAGNALTAGAGGAGGAGGGATGRAGSGGSPGLAAGEAFFSPAGGFYLVNTLVSGASNNCGGIILDGGHNLSNDRSCAFGAGGSAQGVTLGLGALGNNGGLTQTHALSAGSPAIDAGDDAQAGPFDQRLAARTGRSDIGAFEYNGTLAELRLTAARQSTNVLLSWPASNVSINLETSPRLADAIAWVVTTNTRVTMNGYYNVTVPMDTNRFYRLRRP